MLRLLLEHDQVVLKDRWSLNTGGHKDRLHCNSTNDASTHVVTEEFRHFWDLERVS